jgi:cytochrome c-type biogenesis protein CcmF
MIAELGTTLLSLAWGLSILQGVVGVWKHPIMPYRLMPACALTVMAVMLVAFGALVWAFATSDFSMALVASHSHTQSPLLYKITASWGNHEGSFLLWCVILAGYGAAMTLRMGGFPLALRVHSLQVMGVVQSCFIGYLIFTSNPFIEAFPPAMEGEGFNPLLQDIGLAMHPPLLYLGYVGLVVPWAMSVAMLRLRVSPAEMADKIYGWIVFPWAMLTGGIALGSWWAYRELGWGGWWFWDPVENAALLPWLTATALFHATLVLRRRQLYARWVAVLALLSFGLSVLGTFLVRSGLLSSVHSFAADPTRGLAICVLMLVLLSYALYVYLRYGASLTSVHQRVPLWSKELLILLNNMALLLMMMTLLLATFYPFALQAVTGHSITIGTHYFNGMFRMLTLPMVAVCAFSYGAVWNGTPTRTTQRSTLYMLAISVCGTLAIALWVQEGRLSFLAGIAMGGWLLLVTLKLAITKRKHKKVIPLVLGHGGLAVCVLAVTCYATFQRSYSFTMQVGEERVLERGSTVKLTAMTFGEAENYLWQRAEVQLAHGRHHLVFAPEERFYATEQQFTAETSIHSFLMHDYYVTVRRTTPSNQSFEGVKQDYVLELHVNPAMLWLWCGCIMIVIAGVMATLLNCKDIKKSDVTL